MKIVVVVVEHVPFMRSGFLLGQGHKLFSDEAVILRGTHCCPYFMRREIEA